jgi:uncharacterized membrane protein YtjA (UPF0391 family)
MLLNWVVLFLVVAIVAGVFGFGGIAQDSAWIAKVLFFTSRKPQCFKTGDECEAAVDAKGNPQGLM